jgi:hypothetical protein
MGIECNQDVNNITSSTHSSGGANKWFWLGQGKPPHHRPHINGPPVSKTLEVPLPFFITSQLIETQKLGFDEPSQNFIKCHAIKRENQDLQHNLSE